MEETLAPAAELVAENQRQPFLVSRAPEWQWTVADDMMVSPEALAHGFDAHAEEKRVMSSLYSLQYLREGTPEAYRKLVGLKEEMTEAGPKLVETGQKGEGKLTEETFLKLHRGLMEAIPDEESFQAMTYIMLIHDIGKNPQVMQAVGLPSEGNHDEALRRLFSDEYATQRQKFLPTYESDVIFSERAKELIKGVMTLPVNWPGLLQSQTPGAELDNIPPGTDPQIVAMSYWHGILDIAGVMGHKNPSVSLALNEETALNALDGATAFLLSLDQETPSPDTVITGEMRNSIYLWRRAVRYGIGDEFLDAHNTVINNPLAEIAAITARMTELQKHVDEVITPELEDRIDRKYPLPTKIYHDLRTQIIFANMKRLPGNPQDFARHQKNYNDLPWMSKAMLRTLVGNNDAPLRRTHDIDYGPSALRSLESHKEVDNAAGRAMDYLGQIILQADNQLSDTEKGEGGYMLALRELTIAAAKPGFDAKTAILNFRVADDEKTVYVDVSKN